MKKTVLLICSFLVFALVLPSDRIAEADRDPEAEYLSIMVRAASCGDMEAGRAAAICRNDLIDRSGSPSAKISFDDLYLIAKVITAEAGTELSDDWRMCVGEVVLNRVASPEFPDTVEEVVMQEGQYENSDTLDFQYNLIPPRENVELALRLLRGERLLSPWVVFQANFRQGGGVYCTYYDPVLGYTYFCSTSHPELY